VEDFMLDTVRRGPAARRGLAVTAVLGAAGLAITALTGAGLAAAAPHRETTAGRPVPAARPAGQARFPVPAGHPFAVLLDDNAEVVSMASGAVLRVVRPPGTSREFLWVAAAASGRLFVLASRPRSGWLRFSVLRISRDGRAVSLRPVPLARRLHGQLTGLAVSPDGTRFAATAWPTGTGPAPSWLFAARLSHPGHGLLWVSRAGSAMNPSWATGRRLAFGWWPTQGRPGLMIRNLTGGRPGSPQSVLAGAQMIAPGPAAAGGQITANGSAVLTVAVAANGQARLEVRAPGSGRVRRSFPLAGRTEPEAASLCGVLWASPSGHRAIAQCGQVQQRVTGHRIQRVRLALIVPSAGYPGVNTFAW
jgi:hypothetical protein